MPKPSPKAYKKAAATGRLGTFARVVKPGRIRTALNYAGGGRGSRSSGRRYQQGGRVSGRRRFATGGHTHGHDHYIPSTGMRTGHQSVMGGWTDEWGNTHNEGWPDGEITNQSSAFGGHTHQGWGHPHGGHGQQIRGRRSGMRMSSVSGYRRGGRINRKMRRGGRVRRRR